MNKLIIAAVSLFIGTAVSFYSLVVPGAGEEVINFNDFRGKKVLLVNTASNSSQASQLAELQQLYNLYHDSLVVVAFPSNSFGNEPLTGPALNNYMKDSLALTFPVAGRSEVRGNGVNLVYQWLGNKMHNDVAKVKVTCDYQKVLISKKGFITGIFDSSVRPLNAIIQNAIQANN